MSLQILAISLSSPAIGEAASRSKLSTPDQPQAPNLLTLAARLAGRKDVYNARVWNQRRIYVAIEGRHPDKAGDTNLKLWFDAKTERFHVAGWKGNMSAEFHANFYSFCRDLCPYIIAK